MKRCKKEVPKRSFRATLIASPPEAAVFITGRWCAMRKSRLRTSDPHGAWVDTDDLNGPDDALHYTKDTGKLDERFAQKAIKLLTSAPPTRARL
jgi:hypothetical protein